MAKRAIITFSIIFFLLLSISAYAYNEILTPKTGEDFNIGDTVVITGHVMLDQDVSGAKVYFTIYSRDANKTVYLADKYYTFVDGTPVSFSQINKKTLTWIIPRNTTTADDWVIQVKVNKDTTQLKFIESNEFSITDELKFTFSVNTYLLNRGETLEFSGTVLDAHGIPVQGSATIAFEQDDLGTIEIETRTLQEGYIDYAYTLNPSDPEGFYTLRVDVTDERGNTVEATTNDIEVSNRLRMYCDLSKDELYPGEIVTITGNLKNIHGVVIEGLPIESWLTDPSKNTTLAYSTSSDANGNFAFEMNLPKLAAPGIYTFIANTNDTHGNEGECSKVFRVKSTKEIDALLNISKTTWYIGDSMGIKVDAENKGNVEIDGTINFYVDNKKVMVRAFSIDRGERKTLDYSWKVVGDSGAHKLKIIIVSQGDKLLESPSIEFSSSIKPTPFKMGWHHYLVIAVIIVLAAYIFMKRQEIKELIWHRELKKTIGKRSEEFLTY